MFSRRMPHNREQGQAAVEFILVLPFLLLVLFAILQFGVAFKDYLALTDAVRAGARKGAVSRHDPNPKLVTEQAVRNAGVDLGPALEVEATSSWKPGTELTVTAKYPYEIQILWFIPLTKGKLESTTKERVE
jgi:Flp pilus assembly protein TadG